MIHKVVGFVKSASVPPRRDCASSLVIAAYLLVRIIPKDSRALHLQLFTVPSH